MQFVLPYENFSRSVLQSVLKATEGFKDLTNLLSGEKLITFSAVKPLIKVINDKIVIPQDVVNLP